MTILRTACWVRIAWLWGFLAGCSSPREHLYTLEDFPREIPAEVNGRATVIIGPISIPEEVDRPQLIIQNGEYRVNVNEQERWAIPLKESLPRLLAAELMRRLPERRFVPASSAAVSVPIARLLIDMPTLNMAPTGVSVRVHWLYRATLQDAQSTEGDAAAHTELTVPGYVGYAAALRSAVYVIADDIATHLMNEAVR